jgi:hypothetical protein
VNGTPVCTEPKAQVALAIVADGTGGAIVTWNDLRSGNPGGDIFAERVLSVGVVDPAWPANGKGLCTAPGSQTLPRIISDGAAPAGSGFGAIVTWHDARDGTNQIYAQRVLNSGVIALGWPNNGLLISTLGVDEVDAVPVADGAGGAIVAWGGGRNGFHNIRAQHVLPAGVVDAAWPNGGAVLSTVSAEQNFPAIASDAAGGAIVTWMDSRSNIDFDIFAQHVRASGTLDLAYPANGRPLCTLPDLQQNPAIVAAGANGAIVTWMDRRDHIEFDIYALQVLEAVTTDVPTTTPSFTFANPSPNPALGPVTLRFALPRAANVRLAIYDVAGRRVREIASGEQGIGEHAIAWDHRDQAGRAVASGVYFARLEVEGRAITRKLMTVK